MFCLYLTSYQRCRFVLIVDVELAAAGGMPASNCVRIPAHISHPNLHPLILGSPPSLQLARDARCYHAATLEEEGRADVVILASRLAGVGYPVTIRAALGE